MNTFVGVRVRRSPERHPSKNPRVAGGGQEEHFHLTCLAPSPRGTAQCQERLSSPASLARERCARAASQALPHAVKHTTSFFASPRIRTASARLGDNERLGAGRRGEASQPKCTWNSTESDGSFEPQTASGLPTSALLNHQPRKSQLAQEAPHLPAPHHHSPQPTCPGACPAPDHALAWKGKPWPPAAEHEQTAWSTLWDCRKASKFQRSRAPP